MKKETFSENKILKKIIREYKNDKGFSIYVKRLAQRYKLKESIILKKIAFAASIARAV